MYAFQKVRAFSWGIGGIALACMVYAAVFHFGEKEPPLSAVLAFGATIYGVFLRMISLHMEVTHERSRGVCRCDDESCEHCNYATDE